jgi:predicted RNA-binding Zn-ribbon protein involved in translation (DUF1610 family)
MLSEDIVCKKCGWKWNTKDSKQSDKYICHKCGFNNKKNVKIKTNKKS